MRAGTVTHLVAVLASAVLTQLAVFPSARGEGDVVVATPPGKVSGFCARTSQMLVSLKAQQTMTSSREARAAFRREFTLRLNELRQIQKDTKVKPKAKLEANRVMTVLFEAALATDDKLMPRKLQNSTEKMLARYSYALLAPSLETSVELETKMTPQILASITTSDGTVGPILAAGRQPSPDFLREIAKNQKVSVDKVKWASLDDKQQLSLIQAMSVGQGFFANRSMPGVIFKNNIPKPKTTVVFGNKKYGRADRTMNVKKVLQKKVEFEGPENIPAADALEFHMRTTGPAGGLVRDTFTLAGVLGSKTDYAHQHIPAQINAKILAGEAVERFRLVDFYRRLNIAEELRSVLLGYRLGAVTGAAWTDFDFMRSADLCRINDHFYSVAHNKVPSLCENSLKCKAIGFRTGDLYDTLTATTGFGFEVRTIDKTSATREGRLFLDAIQKGLATGYYGIPAATMKQWHASHVGPVTLSVEDMRAKQNNALVYLHYNRDFDSIFTEAPATLRAYLDATPRVKNIIMQLGGRNYALKMLVHDWSRDPALAKNSKAQEQVLQAQLEALRALFWVKPGDLAGTEQVTYAFVKASGLYGLYARSLGVPPIRIKAS